MTFLSKIRALILLLSLAILFLSCSSTDQSKSSSNSSDEIVVRADTSLLAPMLEVADGYRFESTLKIKFEFLPSLDVLNKRTSDTVDIYLFSNDNLADSARSLGLIDSTSPAILAYAVPCLLVPRLNPRIISDLSDLVSENIRVGIPSPSDDILGGFALELLKSNNIYDRVQSHLVIAGRSAREMADWLAKSEIDVGISWTMSVNWDADVFDVVLLLPEQIPRIAVISASAAAKPTHPTNTERFMTYLKTDRCQIVFREWGYLISTSDLDSYAPEAKVGGKPIY
ncbi:MAG: substrate-binding domain-containing protein [bacterium]|nr:substrate-binding domain-containing protein [bacterium]